MLSYWIWNATAPLLVTMSSRAEPDGTVTGEPRAGNVKVSLLPSEDTALLVAIVVAPYFNTAVTDGLAGIEPPVDTVVIEVKDIARFSRSAQNGRRMGLYGKLCIHPDQVAPCNATFTPTAEQVAQARAVVEAFEQAEAAGSASIQVNGQFVDYPIVFKARRVLAAAERAAG